MDFERENDGNKQDAKRNAGLKNILVFRPKRLLNHKVGEIQQAEINVDRPLDMREICSVYHEHHEGKSARCVQRIVHQVA